MKPEKLVQVAPAKLRGTLLMVAVAVALIACGGGGGAPSNAESTTAGTIAGSTAGATAGSTTGATSGSTSGTTAGSTSGTTSGASGGANPLTGILRPNAIYFAHATGDWSYSSLTQTGQNRVDIPRGTFATLTAVPDPVNLGKVIFAGVKTGDALYGIYRGDSLDPDAGVAIIAATFDDVSMLQATVDGSLFVLGSVAGVPGLYVQRSGSLQRISDADTASALGDGTKAVYSVHRGDGDHLYVWSAATGQSTEVAAGGEAIYPQLSKSGGKIIFSSSRGSISSTPFDLYEVSVSGGSPVRLTATDSVSELGASYNESGTAVAYVGLSQTAGATGLYVLQGGVSTQIANDLDIGTACYWTDSLGRSRGWGGSRSGGTGFYQRIR